MRTYQKLLCLLCLSIWVVCVLWGTGGAVTDPGSVPTRSDNDAATRRGFDHFYNLEYDKAVHEFEAAQRRILTIRSRSITLWQG